MINNHAKSQVRGTVFRGVATSVLGHSAGIKTVALSRCEALRSLD